ncbi:AAA family ATPase [Microbacteriaceae bacterium VKM Ac-2855]|nr:AAA family ATPase [Microbacteriaceae bacterium VKM Ac-2855]
MVAGPSGSGKTTLALGVDKVLGLPHTEIDSLFHGPEWTVLPGFVEKVEAFTAEQRWTTEWLYSTQLGELLPSRADTLVWLDLSVRVHMSRLILRTLRRRFGRLELWNGNVEPPLHTIFRDPEHIVRWGWTGRAKLRMRVAEAARDHPHLRIVRLRSQRQVTRWLRHLERAAE